MVAQLVALAFVLGRHGRVKVLAQDDDAFEAVLLWAMLRLLDLLLQKGCRLVSLFGLGQDEAQSNQLMGVAEVQEIVPVLLVEPGHRRQDQDVLLVPNGIGRDGDLVEIVSRNRRRALDST